MVEVLMESGGQDVVVAENGRIHVESETECSATITEMPFLKTNLTSIQKFYAGQSILITGGTGFLGKLLIEKLLRCCPRISFIYLLVRPKKGMDVHQRAEKMFDDTIFSKLKEDVPKFRHQIVVIAGDCSLPGLGISAADKSTLIREVSIVFHVAATVKFDANLKLAVAINIQGPWDILTLCKEMPKLKSIVHVSTAFANCPQKLIEEKFYEPPMQAKQLINLMECINEKLADDITPQLLGGWPNTYAFTKAVAENIIKEEAGVLPIGIFRPSIVFSTYREPIEGWIDNMYGPTGVAAGAGSGLLRTIHCNGSLEANVVPGDLTVNALIASAWDVANKPRHNTDNSDIPIYNYVSSENPITWDILENKCAKFGLDSPTIRAMWYYSFRNNKYKFMHMFHIYLLHLLPALLIDTATLCVGKQPRLLKAYKKIHKFLDVLNYFTTQEWKFTNDNINGMLDKLEPDDREIFFFNMKELDWDKFFRTYFIGIRVYLIKDPVETVPEAKIKWRRMFWMHQALKLILAYIFIRTAWTLLSLIV